MTRTRLDALLVDRGLFSSRARATAAIIAGNVRARGSERKLTKPGQQVDAEIEVDIEVHREFVSRGGIKLANALDGLALDPNAKRCLDVGASTGGFTDCLLQRGAEHVTTLDVAYGELAWGLRQDDRVTVIERTNARHLRCEQLPYNPQLIVIDVSFISLTKVLEPVLACAAQRFDCVALIKPQFEVGKELVGKGGVVRDPELRSKTLIDIGGFVDSIGYTARGLISSGLPGPAGNRETFIWISSETGTETFDIHQAAQEVE